MLARSWRIKSNPQSKSLRQRHVRKRCLNLLQVGTCNTLEESYSVALSGTTRTMDIDQMRHACDSYSGAAMRLRHPSALDRLHRETTPHPYRDKNRFQQRSKDQKTVNNLKSLPRMYLSALWRNESLRTPKIAPRARVSPEPRPEPRQYVRERYAFGHDSR